MPAIRVMLADDHQILREGVRALLSRADDLEVVGEAADGRGAIDLCQRLDPDVVVMDINMPGLGGLEATLEIRKQSPRTKILVLTQYEDGEYVRRFLKSGASGFVLKRAAGAALVDAIRAVARGGLVLDPEIARDALYEAPATLASPGHKAYDTLSGREKQVFKLVAEGGSNKDVASVLDISVKTAMKHRERVMEKLDLHNRTELVRLALKLGVIHIDA